MSEPVSILYVDDDPADRALVRDSLRQGDSSFVLTEASSRAEFEERLEEQHYDLVLTDFNILGFDGLAVMDAVRDRGIDVPIVVVTGTGSEEVAAETIKRGAADYVIKTPTHIKRLPTTILSALERARLAEERKRAYQTIRESEAVFRAMYDQAAVGIVHSTLDGRYAMVNPCFCEMMGRGEDQLLLKSYQDVTHPDDIASSATLLQELLDKGSGNYSVEKRYVRPDGSTVWANMNVSLVNSGMGEPLFLVGIIQDITARKLAQEEVKATHTKLREIFEGSRDGIVIVDSQGRFLDANIAFCNMLGYTLEQLRALPDFYQVTPERWHKWEREEIWENRLFKQKYSGIYEKEYIRRDGTVFPVELHAYAVGGPTGIEYLWGVARDVSERRAAEDAIRESEKHLRLAQEVAHIGSWSFNVRSGDLYWSEELYRIHGLDSGNVVSTLDLALSLVHEDDREATERTFRKVVANQRPYKVEYRIVRPDGEVRHLLGIGRPAMGKRGELVNVYGTSQDITERKRAEEALRESEKRLSKILASSPDAILVFDAATQQMIDVNAAAVDLYGYDREEFLLITHQDISEEREAPDDFIQETLTHGSVRVPVRFHRKKDGTVFPVEISGSSFRLGGRAVICGIVRDITERERSEKALRKSEEQVRLLLESTAEAIFGINLDGTCTFCNPACARILGYESPAELVGANIHDTIHHTSIDGRRCAATDCRILAALRRGEGVHSDEDIFWRKDGTSFPAEYWSYPVHRDGDVTVGVVTFFDITLRKRAERAVRAREKQLRHLARRLQVVREDERIALARELHDQLGERLTGLKMDVDWIKEKISGADKTIADHATSAAQLVESSMELVHDICTQLRPPMLDILGLRSAIEWYVSEFESKNGIACVLELDAEDINLNPEAATAAFRIFQEALTNVLRHARADSVCVKLSATDKGIELSVVDDGVGIDKEDVKHAESLGLLGMTERASVFGGTVYVDGRPEGGTEVTLRLPRGVVQ